MRTSPLNLIATASAAIVLWVLTSFLTAGFMGNSIALIGLTLSEFEVLYRLVLAVAAVAGLAGALAWMMYGASPQRALALDRARRTWTTMWLAQLLVAGIAVVGFVILVIAQSLSAANLGFLFVMMSLHTWVLFWICSLFFSPRTVRYVPWLSR